MEKLKPLKRFGQNYLKDPNIISKIVEEISPGEDDNIIEIGPGQGAMTRKLAEKTNKLIAVEIDKRVIDDLSAEFPTTQFVRGDFLEIDLKKFFSPEGRKLRIVGNIPYNLTSPIIFKMINNCGIISDSVLMVQYEVARRISAKRGTKDYGILAVLAQYFADVKFCFKVSPNVFHPKPKVFSAVIHFFFKENTLSEEETDIFIKIVKASFGNRRKTLKNSLSNSIFRDVNFSGSGIDLGLRAEQLEITDFLRLAEFARKEIRVSG